MPNYPNSWRRPRPSTGTATLGGATPALPGRGTWYLPARRPRMPRLPRFGWVALALLGADVLLNSGSQTRPSVGTRPLPNVSGFDVICGPFDYPGFPYAREIHWRAHPTYSPTCLEPNGGQSFGSQASHDQNPIPAGTRTIIWGFGPNVNFAPSLLRYYTYMRHARSVGAVAATPLAVRPIDVAAPAVAGVLPLTPAIAVAIPAAQPVRVTPFAPLPVFPHDPDRGYWPPLGGAVPIGILVDRPIARPKPTLRPSVDVRPVIIGDWVDVKPAYPRREIKVPSNSAMGRALVSMFVMLQHVGIAQGFLDAMWRSLPRHARTRNARISDRIMDVLRNYDQIDTNVFTREFVRFGASFAAGAALFGGATRNLSETLGSGPGFGLYRAWATGERSYATNDRGYNPVRRAHAADALATTRRYSSDRRDASRFANHREFVRRVEAANNAYYEGLSRQNSDRARQRHWQAWRRRVRRAWRFRHLSER